jgi:hypothetical protein
MARWIRIAETNCKDSARENEYNEWYDKVHIPYTLKSPLGVVSATRYERLHPKKGQGKYLVIYEIETEDIKKAEEAHVAYGMRLAGKGLFSDLLELVSVDNFRKIEPPPGGYRIP